jgi:hypothetical protein
MGIADVQLIAILPNARQAAGYLCRGVEDRLRSLEDPGLALSPTPRE